VQFLGNMIPPALLGPGGVFAWPINAPSVSNSDVFVAKVGSTPQALIGGLQNSVNSLDSAGTLNTGQSNALLAKLNAALASVNSGGASPATIHQLGAFIHQVQGLVLGGVLTSAEAQTLINQANGIIAELGP
jgi:FIMAH domain